jgi:hypothetical protein
VNFGISLWEPPTWRFFPERPGQRPRLALWQNMEVAVRDTTGRFLLTAGDFHRQGNPAESYTSLTAVTIPSACTSQSLNSKHTVCKADSNAIVFSVLNPRTINVWEVFAPSIPPPPQAFCTPIRLAHHTCVKKLPQPKICMSVLRPRRGFTLHTPVVD